MESYTNYTGDLGNMSAMEQATDRVSNFVFIGNDTDNVTKMQYGEYAVYSSFGDSSFKDRTVYVFQKGNTVYVLSEYIAAGENEDLNPMNMIMQTIKSN